MAVIKAVYPLMTIHHGSGEASSDCTAGQFLKVTGDDEYAPQTSQDAAYAGICVRDTDADDYVTWLRNGVLFYPKTLAVGSPVFGSEIEIGAAGFVQKYTSKVKRGLVINDDGVNFEILLY